MRPGLILKCEASVDSEVKRACKEFCKWLRKKYDFPMRIPIYLKNEERIKAQDGDLATAIFSGPYYKYQEPYIKIAVGDYHKMLKKIDKDNVLAGYLCSIAHELTHYYQWLNDMELTEKKEERQAIRYSSLIVRKYAKTREHP